MKRMWQEVGKKKRLILTALGSGIHTGLPPEEIPAGMATDMYNLHTGSYPQLASRPPRKVSMGLNLPRGNFRYFGRCLGDRLACVINQNLYLLEDEQWVDYGVLFSTETGPVYSVDFMGYAVFADGTTCKKFDGTTIKAVGTSASPKNPLFLASNAWHLFTASPLDNYLRYSAVENMDDWTAPGDAGQELIETTHKAYASALCAFGGHILYFKEDAMLELYGTDPSNFSLLPISGDIGCIDQKSIAEINGALYFLGREGVYCYKGGASPSCISFPVLKYIQNMPKDAVIAAGSDGVRYYLSLSQKNGIPVVLVYDTRYGVWCLEDDWPIVAFARTKDGFFGVTKYGLFFSIADPDPNEWVSWSYTSRPYVCENSLLQNWHRMYIRATLKESAYIYVFVSPWLSGEGFTNVGTVTESGVTQIELPTRFYNAPHLRFRLQGEGNATIAAVEFELRGRDRSYS